MIAEFLKQAINSGQVSRGLYRQTKDEFVAGVTELLTLAIDPDQMPREAHPMTSFPGVSEVKQVDAATIDVITKDGATWRLIGVVASIKRTVPPDPVP